MEDCFTKESCADEGGCKGKVRPRIITTPDQDKYRFVMCETGQARWEKRKCNVEVDRYKVKA